MPARFQELHFLGEGGCGQVWEAQDTMLGRKVALKIPTTNYHDPVARHRFLNEARAAAAVNHPHICQIYEVVEQEPPFLVLEYVPGDSLRDRLEALGTLPILEAVRIASLVARALLPFHEKRLIHRDLKPENIKLPNEASVKVLDFGLARLAEPAPRSARLQGPSSAPGSICSPEQARGAGSEVGPWSDQFALGIILVEMLTGRCPFDCAGQRAPADPAEYRRKPAAVSQTEPAGNRRHAGGDSPAGAGKQPGDRFPSLVALADALDAYLAGKRMPPPLPSRGRRWRRVAIVGTLVLLLALVTTGLALTWKCPVPPPPGPGSRTRLGPGHVLETVHKHLSRTPASDCPFQRLPDTDPPAQRPRVERGRPCPGAVGGRARDQRPPLARPHPEARAIDTEETVLAINLKDMEWDPDDEWRCAVLATPTGCVRTAAPAPG